MKFNYGKFYINLTNCTKVIDLFPEILDSGPLHTVGIDLGFLFHSNSVEGFIGTNNMS